MADKPKTQKLADALREKNYVKPGSEKHAQMIQIGYQMTEEKANTIIKERKANPQSWPYEMLEKAEAFLAQLGAQPVVISTKPGWTRDRTLEG